MPKRMNTHTFARRNTDCLAQIGPTRFDVTGIRFFDGEHGASGNPPQEPKPGEQGSGDAGFPANTPLTEMTPEQQAAYWKNESKKHQKTADKWSKLGDYEAVSQSLTDAEAARQSALTDQEKTVEDARKSGEQTGYSKARDSFAKPAVRAILVAQTRGHAESKEDAETRVDSILTALDVQAFIGDDGTLDAAKVETFAQSIAPKDGGAGSGGSGDPLADTLRRQTPTPQGQGGSIAALRAARAEQRASK